MQAAVQYQDETPIIGGKPVQELQRKGKHARDDFAVEPVVGPNGEFQEAVLEHNGGMMLVTVAHGQAMLMQWAREAGWTLYRDICFGRIPGVEGDPRFWRIYELVSKSRRAGKLPARGALTAEQIYHPEVLRRRTERSGGYQRFTAEEFEATLAEMEAAIPEDEKRRLLAKAKIESPDADEDVELEDLIANKPPRGKR